jgi:Tfp pilus assembly protein PilX
MKILNPKSYILNFSRGAASLPAIMAVGILILVVGVSVLAVSLSESFTSLGSSQSATAMYYAELGAKDALIRISRNKNYSGSYTINMVANGCTSSDGCATVTVSSGVGSVADLKVIDSVGLMKVSTRKVRVSVEYTQYGSVLSGEIATSTWQEMTN